MGKFNSSLTRVQPVFNALYERDASGETWLCQLLGMANRGVGPEPVAIPADLGQLVEPPQFEFPADPPKSYLGWLIKHPQRLSSPPEAEWRKWGERTQRKRRALLDGDTAVQAEAIAQLEKGAGLPNRAWWRFEGVTRVDCDARICIIELKNDEASEDILPQALGYAICAETNPDSIRAIWLESKQKPEDIEIDWDKLDIRVIYGIGAGKGAACSRVSTCLMIR